MCSESWSLPYELIGEFVKPLYEVFCDFFSPRLCLEFFDYYYEHYKNYGSELRLDEKELERIKDVITHQIATNAFLPDMLALKPDNFKGYETSRTKHMLEETYIFKEKVRDRKQKIEFY